MCSFNLPLDDVDDPVAANQDELRINERSGDFLTASVAVVLDSASFMITAFMRRNTQEYYVSVVSVWLLNFSVLFSSLFISFRLTSQLTLALTLSFHPMLQLTPCRYPPKSSN